MLKVKNLACTRGERCLFEGLSFDLEEGGLLHLVGNNGIGKSSLLRLLAGFNTPLFGEIDWCGSNVYEDLTAFRQNLIFLPDQAPLKKQLSPDDHLVFWQRLLGYKTGSSQDVGLSHVADLPAKVLSSGQRRRSSFLLLDQGRKLWLLDEPFVGLDHEGVEMLLSKIDQHRKEKGMVLLTSHIPLSLSDYRVLDLASYSSDEDAS